MPFAGKVVWVTGASSGIGEQLSFQLAALGATLILSARRRDKLEEVRSQLPAPEDRTFVLPLDLEQLEELPRKAEEAVARFGRIDILINNAAVALRDFALTTSLETDQKLMRINYFGPMTLTKQLLPAMLARGSGQIVVVSSLSGKYGVPRTSAYAASMRKLKQFFSLKRKPTP